MGSLNREGVLVSIQSNQCKKNECVYRDNLNCDISNARRIKPAMGQLKNFLKGG
jgi:hypothetical protein